MAGRYAPSPSGELHFGNLRTAVLAWLFARHTNKSFVMRIEDIDEQRSSAQAAHQQLADLASLGIDWDGQPLYQSTRYSAYQQALSQLDTYECYCSRREVVEASSAPHARPGIYPGTCRNLSEGERAVKRTELAAQHRVPAIRLRAHVDHLEFHDFYQGTLTGEVDDFILKRGGQTDGWAYNLAVVVDDGFQGVDQIVRGSDLIESTARQIYLAQLLNPPVPSYIHVPLVLNTHGQRLAKRDGAVSLSQLRTHLSQDQIFTTLATSLGYPTAHDLAELLAQFDPANLSQEPYIFDPLKLV